MTDEFQEKFKKGATYKELENIYKNDLEEIKKINNGNVPNKYFEILKIEIPKEKLKKYNFEYSGIDTDSDIVTDIDIPSKYIKRLNDNSINISKTTIPKITQKKTTVIPKMETVE